MIDDAQVRGVPQMRKQVLPNDWAIMCEMHALPDGWEEMPYETFPEKCRWLLMAQIIRRGFETLK
jgi:hypothetical protein